MTQILPNNTAGERKPWRGASEAPFVRIRDLSKRFAEIPAVDDVSLDIWKGEIFCLLGGSGCGKSTLLRMLAGFEAPTSGRIEIDGQDLSNVPPEVRPTNMMFQSYALFPHMTVEANVAYGLRREGMRRAEAMDRTADMLRLVQLSGLEKRRPHQLSGGQRQRVALARSLVKRPKLLLLDEPLGALDRKLREETQFELMNIQDRMGITFIVVTHDQEEAMTLATRIGVMDAGRIRQIDEPRVVYERPANRFVADFIGTVNIFEGTVDAAAPDAMRVRTPEGPVLVRPLKGLRHNQSVAVAVRPEKMSLTREPTGADNQLQATVVDYAYMGDVTIYKLALPGGRTLKVSKANHGLEARPISWDEPVHVGFSTAAGVVLTA
ncbi:polyamine ABC transporter ATP-binding protein [Rhodobacteraceae bacterium 2CG4]|uniref:Spermidine/putrescine import ATP-binding protein PotA n=1 Tax=Halovulum marinum TaxID=2662447 RepID=A0A6L5Z6I2_9RHOB|nr:ABC transporter ATP-binding protein [Halovulum marinum]MSU91582.1 polyamine ABC transporter ATP-binding protein [Halovulum marinum]